MTRLDATPTPPELEGYLSKLKTNPSILGSWAKRYFIVNPHRKTIEYFHDKPKLGRLSKATSSKRSIKLEDITSVADFGEMQFQIHAGKTALMIQANSKAEHSCWVNGLSKYIEELREYELRSSNC